MIQIVFFNLLLIAYYNISNLVTFVLPTCAVLIPAPDDLQCCIMLLPIGKLYPVYLPNTEKTIDP